MQLIIYKVVSQTYRNWLHQPSTEEQTGTFLMNPFHAKTGNA